MPAHPSVSAKNAKWPCNVVKIKKMYSQNEPLSHSPPSTCHNLLEEEGRQLRRIANAAASTTRHWPASVVCGAVVGTWL